MLKTINSQYVQKAADILFPKYCYGCKKPGTYLCSACFAPCMAPHPLCPHCNVRLPFGKLPDECRAHIQLDRLFATSDYKNKTINSLIKDLKYKNAYLLAPSLAQFIVRWFDLQQIANIFKGEDFILASVPCRAKKLKKRGFNPAAQIAEHFSSLMSLPYTNDVLLKIKNTKAQIETANKKERAKNVKDAFAVKNPPFIKNKTVILIDDVITTGSTMSECAKVLYRAGASKVWGITVARD